MCKPLSLVPGTQEKAPLPGLPLPWTPSRSPDPTPTSHVTTLVPSLRTPVLTQFFSLLSKWPLYSAVDLGCDMSPPLDNGSPVRELWELRFCLALAPCFPRAQLLESPTGTSVSFPDYGKELQACSSSLTVSPFFSLTEIILATIINVFSLSSARLRVVGQFFLSACVGCQGLGGGPHRGVSVQALR